MRSLLPAVYLRSDKLIAMGVRKPSVSSTYAAPDPAGRRARDDRARRDQRQGNAQHLGIKLLHPGKRAVSGLSSVLVTRQKSMQAARVM